MFPISTPVPNSIANLKNIFLAVMTSLRGNLFLYDSSNNILNCNLNLNTTAPQGVSISPDNNTLIISHNVTPFIDRFTLNPPTKLPALPFTVGSSARYAAFNGNGTRICITYSSTPTFAVFDTTTNPWTKLTDPVSVPASGTAFDASWSSNGQWLAVTSSVSPFIFIYDTSTVPYTKLANPGILPAGLGRTCDFSPDSTYLVVGHNTTPFITIYDTSTWTKQSNPGTLPSSAVFGMAFNHAGTVLAVNGQVSSGPGLLSLYNWPALTNISGPIVPGTSVAGTNSVAFSSDDSTLAIGCTLFPFIERYETITWTKLANSSALPLSAPNGICFKN